MFLLLSTYLKDQDEVDRWLPEHRAFLDRQYAAGRFLVSGPFVPRTGGIIVTMPMTREEVERILAEDPFVREGVSEYRIQEMKPTKRHAVLSALL
ncbi:MAG TPA: YciI family protein [Candidatus Aquilonibacter sp.]|nr:YciI family protein [Candidatus Aquilonibacter sp.]